MLVGIFAIRIQGFGFLFKMVDLVRIQGRQLKSGWEKDVRYVQVCEKTCSIYPYLCWAKIHIMLLNYIYQTPDYIPRSFLFW